MATIFFLFTALLSLPNPARQTAPPIRAFPTSVGLVIIAATPEGIAIGADGASYNADGTLSQEEKLFAIGKTGAVAIAGTVSIQDQVSRPVREEVNIARIAAAWLAAHSDATLDDADKAINEAVTQATTRYFSTRAPGAVAKNYKFTLIFTGMANGKAVVHATRYYMPSAKGQPMRTEAVLGDAKPGEFWIFGQSQIAQAILGNPSSFEPFSAETPIKQLRSGQATDVTVQDYLNVIDVLLRATESSQAKKKFGKLAVGGPNKLIALK